MRSISDYFVQIRGSVSLLINEIQLSKKASLKKYSALKRPFILLMAPPSLQLPFLSSLTHIFLLASYNIPLIFAREERYYSFFLSLNFELNFHRILGNGCYTFTEGDPRFDPKFIRVHA